MRLRMGNFLLWIVAPFIVLWDTVVFFPWNGQEGEVQSFSRYLVDRADHLRTFSWTGSLPCMDWKRSLQNCGWRNQLPSLHWQVEEMWGFHRKVLKEGREWAIESVKNNWIGVCDWRERERVGFWVLRLLCHYFQYLLMRLPLYALLCLKRQSVL